MQGCNGVGCHGAWDCDSCRNRDFCDKYVLCDQCNNECYEDYWQIGGLDLCPECAESMYKRSVV